MPLRPLLVIATLILSLAMASDARAWNHTGHRVIATIAYDQLQPPVRAKLDTLLKAHPRYEADLLAWMPERHDQPARFAFAMSAYWPDIIRSQANPMHYTHHRPMWHFINVRYQLPDWKPAPATSTAPTTAPTTWPVMEGPKDVVQAIAKCKADLKNPSVSDADKAVAICWLTHLVGDIHQPLHATTLFSAQFPDGDRGGNSFIVARYRGDRENLHAVWDEILGTQTSALIIHYLATSIRTDPTYVRDAMPESSRLDTETWVNESHAIGKSLVYRDGTLTGASSEALRNDPATVVPMLPDGYLRGAETVAVRRAALAGYRLAAVLSEALGE
jgi:hypothetical protein